MNKINNAVPIKSEPLPASQGGDSPLKSSKGYLNKDQVAEKLGITKRGVEELMRKRKIPYLSLGHRTVRFVWSAVEQAIAKFEHKAVGQK